MREKILFVLGVLSLATIAGATGFYFYQPAKSQLDGQAQAGTAASFVAFDDSIIGNRRPDFSLADVNGKIRNIGEWDGKVMAINFWATWCPPCIKEIPEFVAIQKKYQAQGLQFIGIALQRPEEVTGFMAAHGMNYPVLAGEMEVINIAKSYGNDIGALPYTVIVDRQGRIQYIKPGPFSGDALEAIIHKYL